MPDAQFAYPLDALREIAQSALAIATRGGATACELHVSEGFGQTVTVRMNEIETLEYNRDKALGITVYIGKRSGYASTSDFNATSTTDTVHAALAIAKYTASDDANGLAERELMGRDSGDLELFHPWPLSPEEAIDMAKECESAAFALDRRITNSEGATVSTQHHQFIAANTNGFLDGFRTTRHSISCAIIASDKSGMQRDDWYSTQRAPADLPSPRAIGDYAGRRALARLRSRRLSTRKTPVIFEAPVATGLIGHFVSAVSGGNLYRKASFLTDSLGKQVFAPSMRLHEDPFIKRGLASGYFDDDGVATKERDVIRDGVVQGYFLSAYSARKLGMQTTGNAGGSHNLIVAHGERDLDALIREMGTGLLVTDLMGQGINLVTGDYSRGAAGFWVEGGRIRYPVEEITVAGNLRDMFKGIVEVGNDVVTRGARSCGSILIEGMTIAGS